MAEPVEVRLSNGTIAMVDAEDAARVLAHRWHATHKKTRPDRVYVNRTWRKDGKYFAESLHRFVMNAQPGELIDHRDGNPLNCQKHNLRRATKRGNSQNVTLSKNQRRGGFKGVLKHKDGWIAQIRGGVVGADGKRKQLRVGTFATPEEAAAAYDVAAARYFGEYASLNRPSALTTRSPR